MKAVAMPRLSPGHVSSPGDMYRCTLDPHTRRHTSRNTIPISGAAYWNHSVEPSGSAFPRMASAGKVARRPQREHEREYAPEPRAVYLEGELGCLDPAVAQPHFGALGTTSIPTVEFAHVGVEVHQVPRDSVCVVFGASCRCVDFDIIRSPGMQVLELLACPAGFSLWSAPLSPLQGVEVAVDSNMAQPVALEYGERVGYVVRASIR